MARDYSVPYLLDSYNLYNYTDELSIMFWMPSQANLTNKGIASLQFDFQYELATWHNKNVTITDFSSYRLSDYNSIDFPITQRMIEELAKKVGPNSKTYDGAKIYLRWKNSAGTEIGYTSAQIKFSIGAAGDNYYPLIDFTCVDVREETLALTGNANIQVNYASRLKAEVTATPQLSANIAKIEVRYDDQKSIKENSTTHTCYFNATDEQTTTAYVTDSRGFNRQKTVWFSKTTGGQIAYVKPTCTLSVSDPVDGQITLKFTGQCFNGSFGLADNTIQFKFYIVENAGTHSGWQDLGIIAESDLNKSWSQYTYTYTFSEFKDAASGKTIQLNDTSNYTIYARIIDKLNTVDTISYTVGKIPVFDWSQTDFNFNVPVTLTDDGVVATVDGIIEQGTSNNWIYRKWKSGIAECWYRYTGTKSINSSGNGIYYSSPIEVNYPLTFKSAVLTASGGTGDTTNLNWVTTYGDCSTKAKFILLANTSQSSVSVNVQLHAIGTFADNVTITN